MPETRRLTHSGPAGCPVRLNVGEVVAVERAVLGVEGVRDRTRSSLPSANGHPHLEGLPEEEVFAVRDELVVKSGRSPGGQRPAACAVSVS